MYSVLRIVPLVALTLLPCVNALYGPRSDVILLNEKNFDEVVLKTEHVTVVEFFAPWCGHCKNLAPEYEKAAHSLKGIARVAAVDCDNDILKPLCGRYDVRGFPTIKVFTGVAGKRKPQDYQSARTAKAIVDFAIALLPNHVVNVKSSGTPSKRVMLASEFLTDKASEIPRALLFTSKAETTSLYKSLSVEFKDRVLLGEARKTETELAEKFGITDYPTLIVFAKDSEEPIKFDGVIKQDTLHAFLEKHALPSKNKPAQSEPKQKAASQEPTPAPEPWVPEVIQLSKQEDLERECLSKTGGICIIALLPESDESYPPSIEDRMTHVKLLTDVKGRYKGDTNVRFLWAEANATRELAKKLDLAETSGPSLFTVNPRRKVYRPFLGAFDLEGLKDWIDETKNGRGTHTFKYNFDLVFA